MQLASSAASERESWHTVHPLTPRDQAAMATMRAMAQPNKGKLRGTAARAPFEAIIGQTVAPDGVAFHEDTIGGVPGWWCEPIGAISDAVILHLHGGWFNWGSAAAFRNLVGQIARSANANAFVPDYRLAPEHPFPAAVQDAQACLRGLVQRHVRAVAVTGDSAGGNLALSLVSIASRSPLTGSSVVGAAVLSPVTDLAMTGSSWHSRSDADPYFVWEQAETLIKAYLNGHEADDPVASPFYGNLTGLPPIRVHVGDDEVLLDDSLRYVTRAVAAGVDAEVHVWEGLAHGFLGALGRLEASAKALESIGAFLSARLGPSARA